MSFTRADDKKLLKWSMDGECTGTVATLEIVRYLNRLESVDRKANCRHVCCRAPTGLFESFTHRAGKRKKSSLTEVVLSSSCAGATTAAIVTAGEDGAVKIWSRAGNATKHDCAAERASVLRRLGRRQ